MLGRFLVLDSAPLPTNWAAVSIPSTACRGRGGQHVYERLPSRRGRVSGGGVLVLLGTTDGSLLSHWSGPGQAQETAALEQGEGTPHCYALRHLRRRPPGTGYVAVAEEVERLCQSLPAMPLAAVATGHAVHQRFQLRGAQAATGRLRSRQRGAFLKIFIGRK